MKYAYYDEYGIVKMLSNQPIESELSMATTDLGPPAEPTTQMLKFVYGEIILVNLT